MPSLRRSDPFRYVLADSCGSPPGYNNTENINAALAIKKHWLGAFKTNLEVALSKQDRANGRFVSISSVSLAVGVPREVYIRSGAVPVLVCKDRTGGSDPTQQGWFRRRTTAVNF